MKEWLDKHPFVFVLIAIAVGSVVLLVCDKLAQEGYCYLTGLDGETIYAMAHSRPATIVVIAGDVSCLLLYWILHSITAELPQRARNRRILCLCLIEGCLALGVMIGYLAVLAIVPYYYRRYGIGQMSEAQLLTIIKVYICVGNIPIIAIIQSVVFGLVSWIQIKMDDAEQRKWLDRINKTVS